MKKTLTQAEFDVIYAKHQEWIGDNGKGAQADFSNMDLAKVILPTNANLEKAILKGTDLVAANLSGVNLFGADLSGANLSGAKLIGTDIGEMKLDGAFLHGIILEEQRKLPQWEGLEEILTGLENERAHLLLDADENAGLIAERDTQISRLDEEQRKLEDKEYQKKLYFGDRKEVELSGAFSLFHDANSELNKETRRYKGGFMFYMISSVVLFAALMYSWWQYFDTLQTTAAAVTEPINYISIWWYLAPTILITGLMVGAIYQAQAQHKKLAELRKQVNRIQQILAALRAYVRLVDNRQIVNKKINEVLDAFINILMDEDITKNNSTEDMKKDDIGLKATDFLPYKSTFDRIKAVAKTFAR